MGIGLAEATASLKTVEAVLQQYCLIKSHGRESVGRSRSSASPALRDGRCAGSMLSSNWTMRVGCGRYHHFQHARICEKIDCEALGEGGRYDG